MATRQIRLLLAVGMMFVFVLATDETVFGNSLPVAVIKVTNKTITGGRIKVNMNENVCFQGLYSTDPDNDPLTYSWNFGDGTALSKEANPCHLFAKAGFYSVTLAVDDGYSPPAPLALLAGATVDAANNPSVPVPAGWQLVIAQGFDAGPMSYKEGAFGTANVTANNAHSGNHSIGGLYNSDGVTIGWEFRQGNLGSFRELYVSYWDYVDANALYPNSDYFMLDVGVAPGGVCGQVQDFGIDAQNYYTLGGTPTGSSTRTWFLGVSQGVTDGNPRCQGIYQNQTQPQMDINAGTWRQYEFYYKPSTTTWGTQNGNLGDGEAMMFVNGTLFMHDGPGVNLNGTFSMANAYIQLGGVVTSSNPLDPTEIGRAHV
jgi:hypothetical protein